MGPGGSRGTARRRCLEFVEVVFDVDAGDVSPTVIQVTLDPFFDEIENRDALLLTGNDWTRGIVDSEADQLVRLTPGKRTDTVELGDSSQWKNLSASIGLGLDHIRTGPDHMLFIVALLLPSVLIWRSEWRPAQSFGRTLWRLTKIMTMFTLAHSVTFTLTGLGLVPAPGSKVTETIIALSIAATALHSLRPIIPNREWIIALVFGLFHGFGFASLVQELEVSTQTELVSLGGRNIGIEIGQLIVVLLTFPALFLLRVTRLLPASIHRWLHRSYLRQPGLGGRAGVRNKPIHLRHRRQDHQVPSCPVAGGHPYGERGCTPPLRAITRPTHRCGSPQGTGYDMTISRPTNRSLCSCGRGRVRSCAKR